MKEQRESILERIVNLNNSLRINNGILTRIRIRILT